VAATTAIKTPTRDDHSHPIEGYVQKAGTVIYKGTMAMNVAGVFRPCASGVANSVYAGIAEETYDASAEVSDVTYSKPMLFKRVPARFGGKAGDLPTAADLGSMIAVHDNNTVKATTATNDVEVRLLAIDGSNFWVCPA